MKIQYALTFQLQNKVKYNQNTFLCPKIIYLQCSLKNILMLFSLKKSVSIDFQSKQTKNIQMLYQLRHMMYFINSLECPFKIFKKRKSLSQHISVCYNPSKSDSILFLSQEQTAVIFSSTNVIKQTLHRTFQWFPTAYFKLLNTRIRITVKFILKMGTF